MKLYDIRCKNISHLYASDAKQMILISLSEYFGDSAYLTGTKQWSS